MADLRFNVSAETRAATSQLGAFAQDVQKRLVNAVRSLPDIELNADSTDAQRKMKELRDQLATLANQKVGVDIDAGDALAEMQRLQTELRNLGGSTTEVGVRADVGAAEAALGDIEAELARLRGEDVEVEVTADTAQAEGEVSRFSDGAKAGMAAAGAAAGAVFASGLASSLEFGSAQARLTAQLGGTAEESERMGGVAGRLYANAYGENLAEVGDALRQVVQQVDGMAGASDERLQTVTGRVMSLAQAFDQDLTQTIAAAGQMVKTGLADNAEEALDIMTAGLQGGVDKAGDLMEVFTEYGTQFRKLGLDGQAAMGLMSQGLQAGARDADIVADAFKEFSIRAIDGSKTTNEAFQTLGLNMHDMANIFAEGGPAAADALDLVLERLGQVEHPATRSATAVKLFGTQAEDLGEALYALDPSEAAAGLGDVAGAAERLDATLGATAEAKVTAMQRGFEQWSASLIATEGPLGDVGASVAAFGPQAMAAAAAIGPLLVALKMNGVAAAVRGASGAVDEVGEAADRSERRTSKMSGALKGMGALAGVVGAALLIDEATNQGLSDALNHITGMPDAAARAKAGIGPDFWSQLFEAPAPNPSDPWDIRNLGTTVGDVVGDAQRALSGFALEPINIDINADPDVALGQIDNLLAQINGQSGEVNINGNANPAGFALRRILEEIAAGAETILIDGNEVPAQEALAMVKGQISSASGDVTINGQTMPAGEALAQLLGGINASQGQVMIGANPTQAAAQLTAVQGQINAAIGTMTINGNRMPADQALGAVLAAIDAGAATVDINGNKVPTEQALNAVIGQIDSGAGTVTINGQSVPAGQALAALVQSINAARGTSTINGNNTPAYTALNGFLAGGNRAVTTPTVNAATAGAARQMNSFIATYQGRTIDLRVSTAGRLAAGGIIDPVATRARFYARGGVDRPMKRMQVGVPAIAQPGMLRVFGDRSDVPESYIPWKQTSRSLALLETTAAALGRQVVPLAEGDVVRWGEVSQKRWDELRAAGWKGRAGDNQEAIYRPVATQAARPASVPTSTVRQAVTGSTTQRAGAAVQAVADAAVAGQLRALRSEMAAADTGRAQLAALSMLAQRVSAARASGQQQADGALTRTRLGAW